MMKIMAFGASYSKQSINKQFAEFAARQFSDATIEVLDLNQYQLPLFTVDVEAELGSPAPVKAFLEKIVIPRSFSCSIQSVVAAPS